MNRKNEKSYRSYSLEKIEAPCKDKKNEPRAERIAGEVDLRVGGKKK